MSYNKKQRKFCKRNLKKLECPKVIQRKYTRAAMGIHGERAWVKCVETPDVARLVGEEMFAKKVLGRPILRAIRDGVKDDHQYCHACKLRHNTWLRYHVTLFGLQLDKSPFFWVTVYARNPCGDWYALRVDVRRAACRLPEAFMDPSRETYVDWDASEEVELE